MRAPIAGACGRWKRTRHPDRSQFVLEDQWREPNPPAPLPGKEGGADPVRFGAPLHLPRVCSEGHQNHSLFRPGSFPADSSSDMVGYCIPSITPITPIPLQKTRKPTGVAVDPCYWSLG